MQAKKIVGALSALAHDHRLAIYRMLVKCGPDGLPAGLIADQLGVPASSLTFHLQHLLRAELVSQRRLSRQLIYAADFTTMNGLVRYLTENCCGRDAEGAAARNPVCVPATAPAVEARLRNRRKSA